ncbi:MAG TPA: biopolymer transporter ExbD [Thermogutta sp.]|nr:biopolymer transporter ExbD [Thermogutta sp.]HQF13580.1 biopolymer transporter ExbD [Thermogutta sp.]
MHTHAVRGTHQPKVRLNLTPMIDVTFQLILFFLLAGHMAQQESQSDLALPYARTGEKLVEGDTRRLVINVLANGQIVLSGESLSVERLVQVLASEAGAGRRVEVRIRTDKETPYKFISPILLTCARAGLWNVSFAVISKEEE